MSFALVGGGARSGKSNFALGLARARGQRPLFLATARRSDAEMEARIDRHIADRGADFPTREVPDDLDLTLAALSQNPGGHDVVLIDCLTLWLANLLVAGGGEEALLARVDRLGQSLQTAPFASVLVTNEVGMGLHPDTEIGRAFRDLVGRAHQRLAAQADEVYFAVMGMVLRLKPAPLLAVAPGASAALASDEAAPTPLGGQRR